MTTFQWTGDERADGELADMMVRASAASHEYVAQGAHMVELAEKRRAREGGRHKRGTRTPATRGRGPAVISGTLGRSIMVGPITAHGQFGYEALIGPTAIYGRRIELEYNYPYVGPGLRDVRPQLPALAVRVVGRVLGG